MVLKYAALKNFNKPNLGKDIEPETFYFFFLKTMHLTDVLRGSVDKSCNETVGNRCTIEHGNTDSRRRITFSLDFLNS